VHAASPPTTTESTVEALHPLLPDLPACGSPCTIMKALIQWGGGAGLDRQLCLHLPVYCPLPTAQVHCAVTGRDMVADVELVRRHLESEKYKRLQRTAATDFDTYKVCAGTCMCLAGLLNVPCTGIGGACQATAGSCCA
jgi:hypothetical protein